MTTEDHTQGPVQCEQLGAFVDGELDPAAAAAFRRHLAECARCQEEMHGLLQLEALAQDSPPPETKQLLSRARPAVSRSPGKWRWAFPTIGLAFAGAVVAVLVLRQRPPQLPELLASLDARTVSGWPSAMGPKEYRTYQTVRGTAAPIPESLARAELQLEANRDYRALGTVALLRRDFARADAYLARAPSTPDVLADRGLIRLEQSQCGEALEFFDDALAKEPANLPARFNRGLCLKQLRLPFAAERAFGPVSTSAAGGWSQEARLEEQSLDRLRAEFLEQETAWKRTRQELIEHQTAPAQSFISARPSLARTAFYHALSSAPGRRELERLRPTATMLDRDFGGRQLERRIDRVERQLRPGRAALAERYRAWLVDQTVPALAEVQQLRDEARHTGQDDITLQLIDSYFNDEVSAERERLAAEFEDPWHSVRLAAARAVKLLDAGQAGAAERLLRRAEDDCRPASMAVTCWYVTGRLGELYGSVGRPADARRTFAAAAPRLRAAGLIQQERKALLEVAVFTAQAGELALARATFEDLQLREPQRCLAWAWARELLAQGYVHARDATRARAAVAEPMPCQLEPEPWRAAWRLDLGRLTGDRKLLSEAREMAVALATSPKAARREAEQARLLRDEVDLELGAPAIEEELRRRLSEAAPAADSAVRSAQARAWQALAIAALSRSDGRTALSDLARLQQAEEPKTCAVGLVGDVARQGWVTLGVNGRVNSGLHRGRSVELPPSELQGLQACGIPISVLAAGEFPAGTSLPDGMAWAYRVGATAPTPAPLGGSRLLVRNVLPPADLQLPSLGTRAAPTDQRWTVLEGADATPARVLAGLKAADIVDFEVHGIVDAQVPDGAVLVLSEDSNRGYALSATELQAVRLERRPVVLLGACRAATSSRVRAEPWNLPRTLVRSGARAVYASLQDLPDHEVGEFFRNLTARLDSGETPAVALRDERVAWVKAGKTWVRDIVLFD